MGFLKGFGSQFAHSRRRALAREDAQVVPPTVSDLADKWFKECAPRSRGRGALRGRLRDLKNLAFDKGRIERHIKPLIGDVLLKDLTARTVSKFRDDVAAGKTAITVKTRKHGVARVTGGDGTATRTVRQLSAILSFGVREGFLKSNPAFGVDKTPDNPRERYLSTEEIERLGKVLDEAEVPGIPNYGIYVIRLLLLTGCRKSEIEALEWSEVDLDRGFIRFKKSKTGAKTIPLTETARRLLRRLLRFDQSDFVFPSSRAKGHYIGTPKVWVRLRAKAGLDDVRLHDLRHTFASIAAAGGLSLPIIGALLGHTQTSTTARYAHLADHPLRSASEQISARIDQALNGAERAMSE